jgi:hypothetical protein
VSTWPDQRKLSLMVPKSRPGGKVVLVATKNMAVAGFPQVNGRFEAPGHVTSDYSTASATSS